MSQPGTHYPYSLCGEYGRLRGSVSSNAEPRTARYIRVVVQYAFRQ